MELETAMQRGDDLRPAVILIHGMGMDKGIWESPIDSRILSGTFPLSLLLSKAPDAQVIHQDDRQDILKGLSWGKPADNLRTLYHDLKEHDYTVITWSQSRPAGEMRFAVSELKAVIERYADWCRRGIILIGHSRGGLVARKYLAQGDRRVQCLVTLGTPHRGSRMAQWIRYVAPVLSLVNPLLSDSERGALSLVARRIIDFFRSRALAEILPDSPFFKCLDDERMVGIYYVSIGGTDPTLLTLYRNRVREIDESGRKKIMVTPQEILSIPDIFEKIIPQGLFPEEMKQGKGDGLVSAESARLHWADAHYDFKVNHAALLFDANVRASVLDVLLGLKFPD